MWSDLNIKRVDSVFKVKPQLDIITAQHQCLKYYSNADIFCYGKIYVSLRECDTYN